MYIDPHSATGQGQQHQFETQNVQQQQSFQQQPNVQYQHSVRQQRNVQQQPRFQTMPEPPQPSYQSPIQAPSFNPSIGQTMMQQSKSQEMSSTTTTTMTNQFNSTHSEQVQQTQPTPILKNSQPPLDAVDTPAVGPGQNVVAPKRGRGVLTQQQPGMRVPMCGACNGQIRCSKLNIFPLGFFDKNPSHDKRI